MPAVEFSSRTEPLAIARHRVRIWEHCLIRDVEALPGAWRDELEQLLAGHGVASPVSSVLVTRDDNGAHRIHGAGQRIEVAFADLPVWMQCPQPEPVAVPEAPEPEPKPGPRRRTPKAV